MFKNRLGVGLV